MQRVKRGGVEPFRESIIIKYRSLKETPMIEEREFENFETFFKLQKKVIHVINRSTFSELSDFKSVNSCR